MFGKWASTTAAYGMPTVKAKLTTDIAKNDPGFSKNLEIIDNLLDFLCPKRISELGSTVNMMLRI